MFPEGRALEFLLAAMVALIVVGPKDLPILMRKLGRFMAKLRGMAAEFRASFDEMARQSELDELRREVEAMRRGQYADAATSAAHADIHDAFQDINENLTSPEAAAASAMSFPYTAMGTEPAPGAAPEAPPVMAAKPRARKAADPAKPAAKRAAPKRKAATPPEPEA